MCNTENQPEQIDIRSGEHLEAPIDHVEGYMTDDQLINQLMSDRNVLKKFLSTLGCSMSNYQLRETANNAARWVSDLNKCEEEGLTDEMKLWREGDIALLQFVYNHRLARYNFSPNKYRRQ